MCLGANSTSPVLDDDLEGPLATLESILNQPASTKRPHSPSPTCQCSCAALHRAAAAKARKCCGGNCSCPPGACKCAHSAVATQFRCCPPPVKPDVENVTVASSLGDDRYVGGAAQSAREDSDCLSSIQPQPLAYMHKVMSEVEEPVRESMSARREELRTVPKCCEEEGNAHPSDDDEETVGAFHSNPLAALITAEVAEPTAQISQLDESNVGDVGLEASVQAVLNLPNCDTAMHLTEGMHANTAYAGALSEALRMQSTLIHRAYLPLQTHAVSHYASCVNSGVEGTNSNSVSISQVPPASSVLQSQGMGTFPTSSSIQKVPRDLTEELMRPREGRATDRTQKVLQRPNCEDVSSTDMLSVAAMTLCAKCGTANALSNQRGVSAEGGHGGEEKKNRKKGGGDMPYLKREDKAAVDDRRKLRDDGEDVANVEESNSEHDAASAAKGKTSINKVATKSGQGSGVGRRVGRRSLTNLGTDGGLGMGERRRSLTCLGTESRDRTFACSLCTSTFFFKQNRDRHINEVHLGKRPHKCEHPGCEGAFKNRSGLKQHVRTVHEKARPFKCEQCDSAFGQRNHLTQHILVVHNKVKMYDCEFCGVAFSNVGNRTQHIRRRHSKAQNLNSRAQLPDPSSYEE